MATLTVTIAGEPVVQWIPWHNDAVEIVQDRFRRYAELLGAHPAMLAQEAVLMRAAHPEMPGCPGDDAGILCYVFGLPTNDPAWRGVVADHLLHFNVIVDLLPEPDGIAYDIAWQADRPKGTA